MLNTTGFSAVPLDTNAPPGSMVTLISAEDIGDEYFSILSCCPGWNGNGYAIGHRNAAGNNDRVAIYIVPRARQKLPPNADNIGKVRSGKVVVGKKPGVRAGSLSSPLRSDS